MNRLLPKMLVVATFLVLTACAGTARQAPRASAPADTTLKKPATAPTPAQPVEDVTRYRPVFAAPRETSIPATAPARPVVLPTSHVNPQVEQRLRDQAYTNQNVKYAQGYRLLVYLGIERDQVMAIRRTIIGRYPDETDYITFKSPVYRLYIGDYLTRIEAARAMVRLRGLTPKLELEATQVVLNKNP